MSEKPPKIPASERNQVIPLEDFRAAREGAPKKTQEHGGAWPNEHVEFLLALQNRAQQRMRFGQTLENASAEDARAFFDGLNQKMINEVAARLPDGFQVSQPFIDVLNELAKVEVRLRARPSADDGEAFHNTGLVSDEGNMGVPTYVAPDSPGKITKVRFSPTNEHERLLRLREELPIDVLQEVRDAHPKDVEHCVAELGKHGVHIPDVVPNDNPAHTWDDKRLISIVNKVPNDFVTDRGKETATQYVYAHQELNRRIQERRAEGKA